MNMVMNIVTVTVRSKHNHGYGHSHRFSTDTEQAMNMYISHCYSPEQAMNMVKDISHRYSTEHPVRVPVNITDPIRIRPGLAGKHWPEAGRMILAHRHASGPDPFGQNVTQSARTKSDPGWFCTILSGTSVEERKQFWKLETGAGRFRSVRNRAQRFLHTSLLPDQMCLAKPWPCRPSRPDLGRLCTIWYMAFLEKVTETDARSRIWQNLYDQGRFWLHAGRNGHNWP